VCPTQAGMADALGAAMAALNLDGPPFSCALCGVHAMHSLQQLEEHRAGRRHRSKLAASGNSNGAAAGKGGASVQPV
jgi:hypothetical protein